jgi:CRP-like cAMP-binding protein
MFGLKEALSNPPRPHAMSVRALEECELLAIERDDVINRMQSESIKEVMGEEKETAASS